MNPGASFVLRTPLLPYDTLLRWAAGAEGDAEALRGRLRALLDGDPAVEEAIHVASPDLTSALAAWRDDPASERGRRAERSLVRYLGRMAARPTPYGLFAGFGVGRVGPRTQLCVGPRESLRRHVRLDMEYVSEVVSRLDADPALRRRLRYRANSSLYEAAGRLRYVEYDVAGGMRRHRLVAVEGTDYLRAVLAAACRPSTLEELAGLLTSEEVSREEALEFLDQLVDAQLLVSELEPCTTGPEPAPPLLASLHGLGGDEGTAAAVTALEEGQALVESLRRDAVGVGPARYEEIAAAVAPAGVPVAPNRLFQVDLVRPAPEAVLGSDVVALCRHAVRVLHRLAPTPRETPLSVFARAFEARYEGREVPLLEALDEESGIGFDRSTSPSAEASPLLAGLPLPPPPPPAAAWQPLHALLLQKLERSRLAGEREISLTEPELEAAGLRPALPLPGSLAVFGSVLGPGRIHVTGVLGPSAARLLGRFCHADPDLAAAVKDLLRAEEAREPDRVFAEIVHLPEGRAGNVTMRPLLRSYEIPYLGRSGADEEHRIPLQDLLVSVRDGRVLLRSRRLGKEVVPRLGSAHNYTLGIGPYRFLCALQGQGVAPVGGFSWGPLDAAPWLPRVVSGGVVLEPARWRVDADAAAELQREGYPAWRRLQERLGLPRHLQLREGDNFLPLDFENPLLLDAAAHLLARSRGGLLTEALPDPAELVARGPEGAFAHEFVLPFTLEPEPPRAAPAPAVIPHLDPVARDFLPGSQWLYARIDCGTAGADQVLREVVPVAREAIAAGDAESWFFIRYGDPDWHLRLRLRGDPARLAAAVLPRLARALAPLQEAGVVAGLRLDTYRREVERYGGPAAIEAVERIFWADSECAAELLELLEGDAGLDARWRLGLLGADLLLRDLGLDGGRRLAVVRMMRDGLRREFSAPPALLKEIAHRFGRERAALLQLLRGGTAREELGPAVACLERRSDRWADAVAELLELDARGCLSDGLDRVATSLVHMHLNRVLRSAHRASELVIYDLWERSLLVPAR